MVIQSDLVIAFGTGSVTSRRYSEPFTAYRVDSIFDAEETVITLERVSKYPKNCFGNRKRALLQYHHDKSLQLNLYEHQKSARSVSSSEAFQGVLPFRARAHQEPRRNLGGMLDAACTSSRMKALVESCRGQSRNIFQAQR